MAQKVKKRIFEILEVASEGDLASRICDVFIMTLILFNVLAVTLETVKNFAFQYEYFFDRFELFSVVVFTIEYFLRLWVCTADKKFEHPVVGRIRFAITPLILVDLMAILPFYLPMFFLIDLRFIRVVRLFRLLRLLKIGRYSEALKTFGSVLRAKKEELFITFFVALILLVLASSSLYFVEHKAQPKVYSSIPAAMWWGAATLTTVGYGDIYPITPMGKLLGAIISFLGIGMFALPAGILASGFAEELQKKKGKRGICPHCGGHLDSS